MINENSLSAVICLAEKLGAKGLTLKPKESTPLASLVRAGFIPQAVDQEAPVSEFPFMQGSVMRNAQGIVEHDLVMDEVVSVVKKTLTWNMDLARNQVNPAILNALNYLQEYVANAQSNKTGLISIKQDIFHPIWATSYLAGMISRFNETPITDLTLKLIIPVPTELSDLELVDTGVARFSGDIQDFLASLPEGYVREVYDQVFESTSTDYQSSLLSHLNQFFTEPAKVLLIHLLALRLLDNCPAGVRCSADEYRQYITSIISQSGRALCRQISRREADARNKVLITGWGEYRIDDLGTVPITIRVNGDVYDKWLLGGGCPEIIFGSFATDRNGAFDKLLELKEQYLKVWQRQERMLETNVRLQKANHALTGLVRAVEGQIDAIPDEFLVTTRDTYRTNLHKYVKVMPSNWHEEDLYLSVRKTICSVIFPHTEAFEILCAIDAAAKANPEIEIREAGLLALTEIVGLWVAKLISVEQ